MGTTVSLGGDRLGSGKKQDIRLHGYERSTHDLGYMWRSTMAPGTLVPFMSKVALPGDTWDINLNAQIMTHPTIGPLFGSYKVQLDIFQCPFRLYQAQLHNNKLKIGLNMSAIKLPVADLLAKAFDPNDPTIDVDNAQINPSCVLKYLGYSGIGYIPEILAIPNALRPLQMLPYLGYVDIYKQYYANKQEEIGAVIHSPYQAIVFITDIYIGNSIASTQPLPQAPLTDTFTITPNTILVISYPGAPPIPEQIIVYLNGSQGPVGFNLLEISSDIDIVGGVMYVYLKDEYATLTAINWDYIQESQLPVLPPRVQTFPLSEIDDMREYLLSQVLSPNPVHIEDAGGAGGLAPYKYLLNYTSTNTVYNQTQEGLLLKTYQSDLFNNWLNTEWIDGTGGISEITSVDTTGGSFTIDALVMARKVYDVLNRIAVSGGSYQDWLEAVYDHKSKWLCESPIYHGGLSKELVFTEVVSNSAAQGGDQGQQPLGTLAGKGVLAKKHKGGHVRISVDEPSYLIGIISLTPRIDNSQGNNWDIYLETMDDLHKPGMDGIGFQELDTSQMAWWDSSFNSLSATWEPRSAGKQPAWINYMTSVNEVRGNFAIKDNEMFMTLNRRYEFDPATEQMKDLTTYIDPVKFNQIFAQTSLDAQNFWAQIAVDITKRGKISAKIMPNL